MSGHTVLSVRPSRIPAARYTDECEAASRGRASDCTTLAVSAVGPAPAVGGQDPSPPNLKFKCILLSLELYTSLHTDELYSEWQWNVHETVQQEGLAGQITKHKLDLKVPVKPFWFLLIGSASLRLSAIAQTSQLIYVIGVPGAVMQKSRLTKLSSEWEGPGNNN